MRSATKKFGSGAFDVRSDTILLETSSDVTRILSVGGGRYFNIGVDRTMSVPKCYHLHVSLSWYETHEPPANGTFSTMFRLVIGRHIFREALNPH